MDEWKVSSYKHIADASAVISSMLFRMECFDDDEDIKLRGEFGAREV